MARAVEPHKDAVEGTGTAMGTAWPRCRLVCPQPFPLGLGTRSPLGTSRATEEGGGEEEEDARRTFEAGPERPLGVIDDGLPRLAVLHPVRPWRARAFGPCARLLRLAPQELRSPRSLRGKQRKPCVAERAAVLHGGKPPLPCSGWAAAVGRSSQQPWAMGCAARLEAARACTVVRWTQRTGVALMTGGGRHPLATRVFRRCG